MCHTACTNREANYCLQCSELSPREASLPPSPCLAPEFHSQPDFFLFCLIFFPGKKGHILPGLPIVTLFFILSPGLCAQPALGHIHSPASQKKALVQHRQRTERTPFLIGTPQKKSLITPPREEVPHPQHNPSLVQLFPNCQCKAHPAAGPFIGCGDPTRASSRSFRPQILIFPPPITRLGGALKGGLIPQLVPPHAKPTRQTPLYMRVNAQTRVAQAVWLEEGSRSL